MVLAEVLDDQAAKIVESIKLDPSWETPMARIGDTLTGGPRGSPKGAAFTWTGFWKRMNRSSSNGC